MLLEGKVALITGAGSGIGRAIAIGYAKEGATVVVTDVNEAAAKETAEAILTFGGKAEARELDVTKTAEIKDAVHGAAKKYGRFDILVNNAAYSKSYPMLETPIEEWDKTFDTNVRGTVMACQAAEEVMSKQGGGSIINMTSLAAFRGRPYQHAYCAASGTINTVTQNIAHQLGHLGIRVNAIMPGLIETGFEELTVDTQEQREERIFRIPLQRMGKPEDVVGTAVFLASDMAAYITGSTIIVDGGMQTQLSGFRD